MSSARYILIKLEFSRHIFEKRSTYLIKIGPAQAELFHVADKHDANSRFLPFCDRFKMAHRITTNTVYSRKATLSTVPPLLRGSIEPPQIWSFAYPSSKTDPLFTTQRFPTFRLTPARFATIVQDHVHLLRSVLRTFC